MNEALQVKTDNPQAEALARLSEMETPKNEIRWRKGRGGADLPYTDGAFVIRELNRAFAWNWDFEADNEELLCVGDRPFEVKVRGRLTVRLGGQAVTKVQFGSQSIEFIKNTDTPVSIGDAFKGAATDAMKKCASLLGIALDLYDSDSPVHMERNGQPRANSESAARKAAPKDQYQAVVADTGPSKNLMKNPKYSPETGKRLGGACQRLVAHGVHGEELLREVNFALTSFGKDTVQTRYELDDESAIQIAESFNQWADSLDQKAKAGV